MLLSDVHVHVPFKVVLSFSRDLQVRLTRKMLHSFCGIMNISVRSAGTSQKNLFTCFETLEINIKLYYVVCNTFHLGVGTKYGGRSTEHVLAGFFVFARRKEFCTKQGP